MVQRKTEALRRRPPKRAPRRRLLILCEGKVTEPQYFKEFKREYRSQLVDIEILRACGVPKTLVESAVERKKSAERQARKEKDPFVKYDEVWCVFDVDEHPNLKEALKQARDNKLNVALSNPCFELWILLHFQDQRQYRERGWMQTACRGHLPDFSKVADYERLRANYAEAVKRAEQLLVWQKQQDRENGNPSTSVHRLTQAIAQLGKEQFLKEGQ